MVAHVDEFVVCEQAEVGLAETVEETARDVDLRRAKIGCGEAERRRCRDVYERREREANPPRFAGEGRAKLLR